MGITALAAAVAVLAATNSADVATNAADAARDWETPEIRAARIRYEAALKRADEALADAREIVEREREERRRVGPPWHVVPKFKTEDERRDYEIRQRMEIIDVLRQIDRAAAERRVRTDP